MALAAARVRATVWALDSVGVESREAGITLSCTSWRLASNHVRRLQTNFVLTSTESFANAGDAIAVSNIITDVLQHLSGVRDSGGVCAGGGGCGDNIPRGSGGIGLSCLFVSPAPADQFLSGDPDTPCWGPRLFSQHVCKWRSVIGRRV